MIYNMRHDMIWCYIKSHINHTWVTCGSPSSLKVFCPLCHASGNCWKGHIQRMDGAHRDGAGSLTRFHPKPSNWFNVAGPTIKIRLCFLYNHNSFTVFHRVSCWPIDWIWLRWPGGYKLVKTILRCGMVSHPGILASQTAVVSQSPHR